MTLEKTAKPCETQENAQTTLWREHAQTRVESVPDMLLSSQVRIVGV